MATADPKEKKKGKKSLKHPMSLFKRKEKNKPNEPAGKVAPCSAQGKEKDTRSGASDTKASAGGTQHHNRSLPAEQNANGNYDNHTEELGSTEEKKVGNGTVNMAEAGCSGEARTLAPTRDEPAGRAGPPTQVEDALASLSVALSSAPSGTEALSDVEGRAAPPVQVKNNSASSLVAPAPPPLPDTQQPTPTTGVELEGTTNLPIQLEGDGQSPPPITPAETAEQAPQASSMTVGAMIQNDEELLYSLSLRLDAPHRVIKNHEHLASKLGVSADVRARCKLNTTYNPTKQLLELLDAEKPQLTVADIIYALQQIHRNDVVNIIEDALPGAASSTEKTCEKINTNENLMEAIATKLDPTSRVIKYWLHLGLELGVEKDRLDDLKSGTDPTMALMEFTYEGHKADLEVGKFKQLMKDFRRNDVLSNLSDLVDNDQLMSEAVPLDSERMAKICRSLNKTGAALKGWKHLANALKIPRDVWKGFDPSKPESPTKILFNHLVTDQPTLTVEKLCTALSDIGRNDVLLLITDKLDLSSDTNN